MTGKTLAILTILVLCLSIGGVLAPPLASPAHADPMETLSVTITSTSCAAPNNNMRNLYLQPDDEIIQFNRSNWIVGSNPSGCVVMVGPETTLTVSGDLNGTMTASSQTVAVWWDELSPADQVGYVISTVTFDDGHGNTFSGVAVSDTETFGTPPNDHTMSFNGFIIATSGTGQIIIGETTGSSSYDSVSGCSTSTSTGTLRRYASVEVSGPGTYNAITNVITGNTLSLSTSYGPLPTDELLQFRGSNLSGISKDDPINYYEGISASGPVTGDLTGTVTHSLNTLLAMSPTVQGWAVGTFSYSDGSGTINGVMVEDDWVTGPDTSASRGYMFAPSESGKEYLITYDTTYAGGTNTFNGSLYTLEPLTSVTTATGTGAATFDSDSGTIENLTAVAESSLPSEGKPALEFPHGFFEFDITGLSNGETVTLTIELPSPVPVGTQYWKYGPTTGDPTPHWYQIAMGDNDGDNIITITLQDGGLGDDDLTANGVIVDQGGPGNPPSPGGAVSAPVFPSVYAGIAAALSAAVVAYIVRRKLVHQS